MAENAPKNNTSKTNNTGANATKTNNTSATTGANATKTNNTAATTGANKSNSSLNAEINKLLSNNAANTSKTNNTSKALNAANSLNTNKGNGKNSGNSNNNNNNNENNLLKDNNLSKKNNNKNKTNIEEPSLISQGAETLNNALSSIKESIMGEPEANNSNKSNKSASTSNKTNGNKTNENKNRNNEESRKRYEGIRANVEPERASSGGSIFMLVIKVVIMVVVLVVLYYLGNYLIKRYLTASVSAPYLMNTTKNAKNALVVSQDPNSINYIPILKSEDQDGIQFTYGFWFLIESMDYKKGEWKHVFHKGNSSSYPNRAPGVWFHPDKNSIRVYMNTMDNILEYVDVDNLPIRKWVYMNVILNNRNLDLYVNGYLKIRKELSSLPKQNDDDFWVSMYGGFEGYLSNIRYYAYAIDFNEIYSNINAGPSTNNCIDTGEVPPYLDDKWWFDYNG
jgi:hypothetical protein